MLCLYVQAPFAVFRTFSAGSFRPTAPFLTHSAAYGLLLNLAGLDMREDDGKSVMTVIRKGLPVAEIALGQPVPQEPRDASTASDEHWTARRRTLDRHSLYQQLHNYPVGGTGKEHRPFTKGSKYNIVPARREVLSDLRAYIGLRGNDELENQVRTGLSAQPGERYGLPFLGDNNFLPDRIEICDTLDRAYWYVPLVEEDAEDGMVPSATRLTVTIDRADMSRTRTQLFRLSAADEEIPSSSWIAVNYC